MAQELTTHAKEKGTYAIDVSFYDEDNNPVIPTAASWTLTDLNGTVINAKENIPIPAPLAATKTILLSNLDLAIQPGEVVSGKRRVSVHWTYDSALGAGLPGNDEIDFYVDNLLKVS